MTADFFHAGDNLSVEEKFRDKQDFDMLYINVLVPRWRGVFLTYLELSTSNNKWVMALLIFNILVPFLDI
jgi:hypothetical protein